MDSKSVKETKKHIGNVYDFINKFRAELLNRAIKHDKSKLEDPEVSIFEEFTPKLKNSTYNSNEYKGFLKDMKPALDHHYSKNSHHPEHYKNGIDGMNLVDIIELYCDWAAASMRHSDGDLKKSIQINKKRFDMSDQLTKIFENSMTLLGKKLVVKKGK